MDSEADQARDFGVSMIELPEAKAILATIAWAEGTSAGGRDPYSVVYGYGHTIKDFSDHPALTGEWRGKVLPPEYCRRAGLRAGCKSTAAGAYQITLPTWTDPALRRLYSPPDFSPAEQDAFTWFALCRLLGIPELLSTGRVGKAIIAASKRWSSFPKASSGQPKRSMAQVLAAYEGYLERAR